MIGSSSVINSIISANIFSLVMVGCREIYLKTYQDQHHTGKHATVRVNDTITEPNTIFRICPQTITDTFVSKGALSAR